MFYNITYPTKGIENPKHKVYIKETGVKTYISYIREKVYDDIVALLNTEYKMLKFFNTSRKKWLKFRTKVYDIMDDLDTEIMFDGEWKNMLFERYEIED